MVICNETVSHRNFISADGSPLKDFIQLLSKKMDTCHYCNEPVKKLTRDHKFPKSKIRKYIKLGIPLPEGFDHQKNIVMACGVCNMMKGDRDYDEFMSLGSEAIRLRKIKFLSKASKRGKWKKKPWNRKCKEKGDSSGK